MISHQLYRIFRLKKQLVDEPLLLLGILSARHKEIVADEYALLITFVEEYRSFKVTATPYSKHICSHITRALYECRYLFVTLLGGKGITRYPVTAATEYLFFIDYYLEAEEIIIHASRSSYLGLCRLRGYIVILRALGILMINNAYRSDTELSLVFRRLGFRLKAVKRLLTVACRIPKLRIRDIHLSDHKLAVCVEFVTVHYSARGRNKLRLDNARLVKSGQGVLCDYGCAKAIERIGTHVNVLYLKSCAVFKINGTEDSHSNESRNPVPAIRTLHTARVDSVTRKCKSSGNWHSIYSLYRRCKRNTQVVVTLLKDICNVKRMRDKHIVSIAKMNTVKVYGCEGIKTVKYKSHVIRQGSVESRLIYRRAILYPTVFIVIVAIEYILDDTCRDKIGVQATGNLCRKNSVKLGVGKAPSIV